MLNKLQSLCTVHLLNCRFLTSSVFQSTEPVVEEKALQLCVALCCLLKHRTTLGPRQRIRSNNLGILEGKSEVQKGAMKSDQSQNPF